MKSLTPYCGVYKSKEEFITTVLDTHPTATREDLTFGIQNVQVRNKNGVECSTYETEVHYQVGLTAFFTPSREFILLEGIYQQHQASTGYLKLVA